MSGQSFHVIRCVQCQIYQVHIIKKSSNKWNCKVCSTKQSVQQVFGKGSSGECRGLVQRLNEARGVIEDQKRAEIVNQINQEILAEQFEDSDQSYNSKRCESSNIDPEQDSVNSSFVVSSSSQYNSENSIPVNSINRSKWAKFLDEDCEDGNHLY